jgi:hypothetical protein
MVGILVSNLTVVVVKFWVHAFRDVGAGLMSGIFSDMAVTVKMAGAKIPFVSRVCRFVWCFWHGVIVLWRPGKTVVMVGIMVLLVIVVV